NLTVFKSYPHRHRQQHRFRQQQRQLLPQHLWAIPLTAGHWVGATSSAALRVLRLIRPSGPMILVLAVGVIMNWNTTPTAPATPTKMVTAIWLSKLSSRTIMVPLTPRHGLRLKGCSPRPMVVLKPV